MMRDRDIMVITVTNSGLLHSAISGYLDLQLLPAALREAQRAGI